MESSVTPARYFRQPLPPRRVRPPLADRRRGRSGASHLRGPGVRPPAHPGRRPDGLRVRPRRDFGPLPRRRAARAGMLGRGPRARQGVGERRRVSDPMVFSPVHGAFRASGVGPSFTAGEARPPVRPPPPRFGPPFPPPRAGPPPPRGFPPGSPARGEGPPRWRGNPRKGGGEPPAARPPLRAPAGLPPYNPYMTALLLLLALAAGPLDLDPDDLRPGLVGAYHSLAEPRAAAARIDPKPAFTLGRSSPHPRIPPGPFEVTWTGVLSIRDPGPLAFSAIVGGELTVTVDGVTVLDGRGPTDTSRVASKDTLTREPGYYPLTIRYRSLADVPGRLQLWWEGPSFAAEVIPAWRFGHVDKELSPPAKQDLLAARGRAFAGKFGCARCHVL